MGSFIGHALPGTLFCIWGLWHMLYIYYYYLKYRNSNFKSGSNRNKKSKFAFTLKCCTKTIPIEGIIKVAVTLIGMSVESLGFIWGFAAMYQHFTMYASFFVAGVVDILLFYDFSIPPNVDYCLHVMAFVLEGTLFAFHLHGRSQVDVVLHTLLVYACFFSALTVVLMMINKRIIVRILFAISVLIQGSWFWQAGQILYPITNVTWCQTCHEIMMLSVMIFCWHVILNVLFSLILFFIMSKIITPNVQYQQLNENKDDDLENQHSHLLEDVKVEEDSIL